MSIETEIQRIIDEKTKPPGSLGMLESLAFRIARIQNSLTPRLSRPRIVIFAGDHGVCAEGVSPYPSEVTAQMVKNFLAGGAAVNAFCRTSGIELEIVDAGVNADLTALAGLVHAKIKPGTENFTMAEAMSPRDLEDALAEGARAAVRAAKAGCNCIGFGEMGIGNTTSAAALMSAYTGYPVERCTGRGTGLDDRGLARKIEVIERGLAYHRDHLSDAKSILARMGGLEIAMIAGGILEARRRSMVILIDGFIASAAYLAASRIRSEVADNVIFCHLSDEQGHRLLLDHLDAKPLLNLSMRLGEGSGAAVAYPLLVNALAFFNEMASFSSAGVSGVDGAEDNEGEGQ
ncbi:nicotinate-nucleotide--dimethylbenzimidazole phosphoribosyltransferase [Salinispira pacifica]|uniref:Nicotinate-nucleotide--dimethylbenzimidazole phosphoribosyltransferase n=1 Tax=Salinispira pacifica TaxID=1307761 RepID=V5WIN2_9SPIO|nr:nicotinate-nucleotide--dimethylbenzimidazole phosphoribosyltransferase [Salinispira pacifica]AHC15424.1 Nicotinate-nucleotide--dimethylbenzimidazole phosphoribosyltransferase [Salinispira pacifica]